MRIFKADLHIHSCLSPCAELDMSPRSIINACYNEALDIIAICDHNSAENVGAVIRAGNIKGVHVIPGLEICSREEVHILGLFKSEKDALRMQEIIYNHLPGINRPEIFGDQVIVNEYDEVKGFSEKLLIGATQLSIYEIEREIHKLNGVCILSHVDKPSYSIISQLGFIPRDFKADAIEISFPLDNKYIDPFINYYPVIYSSDAHFLRDIGKKYTKFLLSEPNLNEIYMALKEIEGRRILE